MRQALLPLVAAAVVGSGCAYFNGVYNAREAERRGDRHLAAGRRAEALEAYAAAAAAAESTLVRHPDGRWFDDALYIAGRAGALAEQCERAVPRLRTYLERTDASPSRRDQATLALGRCLIAQGRHADAISTLAPVASSARASLARESALWTLRAALAAENDSAADRAAALLPQGDADWEIAAAAARRRDLTRAGTLLSRRAAVGDYRPEADEIFSAMWLGGERDAALAIIDGYEASPAVRADVARLHLLAARRLDAIGDDSLARERLARARSSRPDSITGRAIAGQLLRMDVRRLTAVEDVVNAATAAEAAHGSAAQAAITRNARLLRVLTEDRDTLGAGLFLAAEVARDSLGASALAHALFLELVGSRPESPLAPRALLAAAVLSPDSATRYRERLMSEYRESAVARYLDGTSDGMLDAEFAAMNAALTDSWRRAVAAADTAQAGADASALAGGTLVP